MHSFCVSACGSGSGATVGATVGASVGATVGAGVSGAGPVQPIILQHASILQVAVPEPHVSPACMDLHSFEGPFKLLQRPLCQAPCISSALHSSSPGDCLFFCGISLPSDRKAACWRSARR